MSVDQRIVRATEQLEADVQLTHEIVNGDENTEVPTEGGPVPSHAKVAKDSNREIIGLLKPTVDDINEHAEFVSQKAGETGTNAQRAETAADNAEAIVYEGDASIEPKPGSIPVADSKAKIHVGWLPDMAVPFPDVWLPLNDSLTLLAGFGKHDQIDVSPEQDGSVMVDLPSRSAQLSRSSTAGFINKSGETDSVSANLPRFEKKGILLEAGGTNFLVHSEDIEKANKFTSTPLAYTPAEEGGIGGGILSTSDPERSAYYRMTIGGSGVEGEIISSVFIKPYNGTLVRLGVVQRNGSHYLISTRVVNLETGDSYYKSEKIHNGLYRVSVRYDCGSGLSSNSSGIEVSIRDDILGDVFIGGWQVQQATSSSRSYIKTEDAPVTRNRDSLIVHRRNNFPAPYEPFSVFAKVNITGNTESFNPILGCTQVSGLEITVQFGQLRARPNDATPLAYITSIPSELSFVCVFDGTHTTLYIKGKESVPVPYDGIPVFTEEMYIGGARNFGNRICGNIHDLKIFHDVISKEQREALGV